MIDGETFFWLVSKKWSENIWQSSKNYDCLLYYLYFNKNYSLIAIDLSNQQARDADPKAIQQINFTGELKRPEQATMFFITAEAK